MSKNLKLGRTALATVFLIFNVITFAVPTDKTSAFWIAYAFTVVAFSAQLLIWNLAFSGAETLKSKYLGLPIVNVGIFYLVIQLIAFGIFLALPWVGNWIPIIVCVVISGTSGICLIATDIGRGEVVGIEAKIQRKASVLKGLQVEVELMAGAETDISAKEALEILVDELKYSDPISDESLAPIEDEICTKIIALKMQPTGDISNSVKQIEMLLLKRNKNVKLLK